LKIEKPIDILVRRRAALGDVIYTTGVVRELYNQYRGYARITVQTDFPEVFANSPYVHHVVSCDTGLTVSEFDIYHNLDNCYEYNPCNHYVDSYFHRVFGDRHELVRDTELHPTDADREAVDKDLEFIGDKFIAVHMRQWHWELKNIKQDVWFEIFEKVFTERVDYKIVFVGGEADGAVEHPLMINTCGRYSPQELKCLLEHAACFVGIDSGPYAIATTTKTPMVTLLSHMPPSTIIPIRANGEGWNTKVVQASVDCVGCYERQQRPVSQIVCERGDYACNSLWDTDKISQAILGYLK
jgi:ADP-heptose:LPS heptosyltransferase